MIFSDVDILNISQVCKAWREVVIRTGVVRKRAKQLGEPEIDQTTLVSLEKKYGEIDDVFRYCYTKHLSNSGVVYGWGCNYNGQLTGDMDFQLTPKEITEFGTVTNILADDHASFVIRDGKLVSTRAKGSLQSVQPTNKFAIYGNAGFYEESFFDGLQNYKIKQVACDSAAWFALYCLTTDGEVFTLGNGPPEKLDLEPISQIACGSGKEVAL